jgi:hypothetical protein
VSQTESFKTHLPAIFAATTATVAVTILSSYLGVAGTLAGAALSSLLTGGSAWWAEKWYRRLNAKARAIAEARKRKGSDLTPDETSIIHQITDAQEDARTPRGIPWKLISLMAGATLILTISVIAFIELGTGQPISATVQGKPAHGLIVPEPVYTPEPVRTTLPPVTPTRTAGTHQPASPSPAGTPSTPPATAPPTPTAHQTPAPPTLTPSQPATPPPPGTPATTPPPSPPVTAPASTT